MQNYTLEVLFLAFFCITVVQLSLVLVVMWAGERFGVWQSAPYVLAGYVAAYCAVIYLVMG
jgi:hypothetical protein